MVTATQIRKGIVGIETEALGADPSQIDKVYQFRYRVVDFDDVIPSHTDTLLPNPEYPEELQPRLRDRAASKMQIENIARNLNPRALLQDSGFIDTGPMIVGEDLVVESGNGRVLALRKASSDFPEQYDRYKKMLEAMAEHFGIDREQLGEIKNPILVRERLTKVDRGKFAAEANVGAVMGMSPYEQTLQDAAKLSPNVVANLQIGEEQTIDQALRMRANDDIIKHFVGNIPATERATIADEKGTINQQGLERIKLALFAKTYTGDGGKRLVRIFGESADPQVKSIENAMFASLPDMAKAEGLIAAKARESDLSIAPDMAEVVDTYASLKATGLTIPDYLAQQAMFEERLNSFQKQLLEHLDDTAHKPKLVREMLRDVAQKILDAPSKGQIGMMGLEPLTKEAMVYAVINRQRTKLGKTTFPATTPTTSRKELEKPDVGGTESAGRLQPAVGIGTRADTAMASRTSVSVGLAGLGKESEEMPKLYRITRGFEEDATLRAELETQQGYKLYAVFDKPEIATEEMGKLIRQDIKFVQHISSPETGKKVTWEVYTKPQIPKAEPLALRMPKGIILKGKRYTMAELREIHAGRSPRSIASDNRQLHSMVIDNNNPRVGSWIINPGRADIKGIDTPRIRIPRPSRITLPKPRTQSKGQNTGLQSVKRGKIYHTPIGKHTLLSRHSLGRRKR